MWGSGTTQLVWRHHTRCPEKDVQNLHIFIKHTCKEVMAIYWYNTSKQYSFTHRHTHKNIHIYSPQIHKHTHISCLPGPYTRTNLAESWILTYGIKKKFTAVIFLHFIPWSAVITISKWQGNRNWLCMEASWLMQDMREWIIGCEERKKSVMDILPNGHDGS